MPPLDLNLVTYTGSDSGIGWTTFSLFVTLAGQNIEISEFASVL